jgi:DNA polymerase-3 subunit epsilon
LEYTLDGQQYALTSAERIRELLEQVIPLQGARRVRKARQVQAESPMPVAPAALAAPPPASAPAPPAAAGASPAPEAPATPLPLDALLPQGSRGFAVIDLETTGFGSEHRILEIAVIRLEPDGSERDVWETLVHPGMPIPGGKAQKTHRIHDWMVEPAPSFEAVAGELAARLDGHVLVAHNLPFDQGFLERRFEAVDGIRIDLGKGLNTMKSRESLEKLCGRLGVELPPGEAHCALVDARALQQALLAGISHLQPAEAAVRVDHNGVARDCVLHTRKSVGSEPTPPPAPPPEGWSRLPVPLTAGAEFIRTDVPEASARALAERLGLEYRSVKTVQVNRRPAILLAGDLNSSTTKMRGAREQGVPVLLLQELQELTAGATAMGWVYTPGDQEEGE